MEFFGLWCNQFSILRLMALIYTLRTISLFNGGIQADFLWNGVKLSSSSLSIQWKNTPLVWACANGELSPVFIGNRLASWWFRAKWQSFGEEGDIGWGKLNVEQIYHIIGVGIIRWRAMTVSYVLCIFAFFRWFILLVFVTSLSSFFLFCVYTFTWESRIPWNIVTCTIYLCTVLTQPVFELNLVLNNIM